MHRLKLLIFFLFISIVISASCSFVSAEESLSVTTYYPSPYGVYNEMRLFPHTIPVTPCNAGTEGTMFYNLTSHNIQICRGTAGWGDSSGLWASSGDDIYNTNTDNVGIGTNVPGAKLEVNGNMLFNGTVEGNTGGITIPASDIMVGGGADGRFALRSKDVGSRKVVFGSENAGGMAAPWTMAIDNLNRRVGIGTTFPTDSLHIYGNQQMAEMILQSDNNVGNYSRIHFDNTNAGGREYIIGNYGNDGTAKANKFFIRDQTAGADRFVIDNNGNIGIGVTSPQGLLHLRRSNEIDIWLEGNSPDVKFLSLTAAWDTFRVGLDDDDGTLEFTLNERNTGDPDHKIHHAIVVAPNGKVGLGSTSVPTYQLQLSANSAAKPTSSLWTVPSDIRIKRNIKPFTDGLGVIKKIHPVSYQLNGKAGLPLDEAGIGVVAQDIKDVVPYSIKTWKAKLEPADSEETELYDFDSNALTYVLINAVKEQQKLIEKLKAQVNELKGNY